MTREPLLLKLVRSKAGNVLPMAAVALVVLTGLVGGGVDASHAYMVKNRLQNACDSAVLAGRRAVSTNGYDEKAKEQANLYFAVNFNKSEQSVTKTNFFTVGKEGGNRVEGTATTRVDAAIMQLFGHDSITLTATCVASMSVGNSDIVMVLDTTGSMEARLPGVSETRLQALQKAMKNFYKTVASATAGSNARVRFGFVPYSSSVNVGRLLSDLNPNYLVSSYGVQSRLPNIDTVTEEEDYWQWTSSGWQRRTRTVSREVFKGWTYQQRTDLDYAAFKSFAPVTTLTNGGDDGPPVSVTSTWAGCIEERATVPANKFSFSPLVGMSPADAYDLDIDSAPDASDDRTKWAPMWPEVAYYRTHVTGWGEAMTYAPKSPTGRKASSYCPRGARLLSQMSKTEFDAYADSLIPVGATYHDIGMIWGARLSSPEGIFRSNVTAAPANGGSVARHVIFMTDGEMAPNYNIQSSYGVEYLDRRVTDNGYKDQAALHTRRFLAVCEATKAKGLRIWVIAFASDLTSNLRTCASDDSSFLANDAGELNKAFQDIAREVGELRIVE